MSGIQHVCVFCGSSPGRRPEYTQAAEDLGRRLAQRGLTLVYGGGRVGLMGTVADSVLAHGGRVIGVIPDFLASREIAHAGLTELHVVPSMHARKALMAERADAFIAMAGGFGTLEEFLEITTWAQLGLHRKPLGLLNTAGYYDGLLTFFDHLQGEQFISPALRQLVMAHDEPDRLLDHLLNARPPEFNKWAQPPDTNALAHLPPEDQQAST